MDIKFAVKDGRSKRFVFLAVWVSEAGREAGSEAGGLRQMQKGTETLLVN